MAAISAFMASNQRPYPTHYMETSITTYLNACRYFLLIQIICKYIFFNWWKCLFHYTICSFNSDRLNLKILWQVTVTESLYLWPAVMAFEWKKFPFYSRESLDKSYCCFFWPIKCSMSYKVWSMGTVLYSNSDLQVQASLCTSNMYM